MSQPSIPEIVFWTIGPPLVAAGVAAVALRWVVHRFQGVPDDDSLSCAEATADGTIRAAGSTGSQQLPGSQTGGKESNA